MENREDLKSILPYLPLKLESSTLAWPHQVIEALKSLSQGPSHSRVDSGEVLFLAISDLRNSLSLSPHLLAPSAADGYALFFDEVFFFCHFLFSIAFFFWLKYWPIWICIYKSNIVVVYWFKFLSLCCINIYSAYARLILLGEKEFSLFWWDLVVWLVWLTF